MASIGGEDDKNRLIVWDVETGNSLYGTANRDVVRKIKFFNNDEDKLIAILDKGV